MHLVNYFCVNDDDDDDGGVYDDIVACNVLMCNFVSCFCNVEYFVLNFG